MRVATKQAIENWASWRYDSEGRGLWVAVERAIRAEFAPAWNLALEEAAKVADHYGDGTDMLHKEYPAEAGDEIAARIRALKSPETA